MVHLERFETWVFVKVCFFFILPRLFTFFYLCNFSLHTRIFKDFFKASKKGNSSCLDNCWPDLFLCQINKKRIFLKKNLGRLDILFKLDPV